MNNIKRARVSDLQIGVYVHKIDGPWLNHGFWRRSFEIRDQKTLDTLAQSGVDFVWIDADRGLDVSEPPPGTGTPAASDDASPAKPAGTDEDFVLELADGEAAPQAPQAAEADDDTLEIEVADVAQAPPPAPSAPARPVIRDPHAVSVGGHASRLHRDDRPSPPSEADWERARKVCSLAKRVVTKIFDDVSNGRQIDTQSVMPVVDGVIESVGDQPGTLTSLARLKQQDQYTFMHSVAVCALMTTLALELGMDDDSVREAATAGLLHDIGKMTVDLAVLNKPGKLTAEEFEAIKRHTTGGHEILRSTGSVGPVALDVALHHHERLDGKGYPEGLSDEQISVFARMGTICDVYDAVTSDRPYKKAWEPAVALHHMTKWAPGAYDATIFQAFVKSIGVFPNGSLVMLRSGRLAVVLDQHHANLLTPVVKVFFSSKSRQPLPHEIVDLSRRDCNDKIASREEPARWGFKDLTPLWMPVDMRRI